MDKIQNKLYQDIFVNNDQHCKISISFSVEIYKTTLFLSNELKSDIDSVAKGCSIVTQD